MSSEVGWPAFAMTRRPPRRPSPASSPPAPSSSSSVGSSAGASVASSSSPSASVASSPPSASVASSPSASVGSSPPASVVAVGSSPPVSSSSSSSSSPQAASNPGSVIKPTPPATRLRKPRRLTVISTICVSSVSGFRLVAMVPPPYGVRDNDAPGTHSTSRRAGLGPHTPAHAIRKLLINAARPFTPLRLANIDLQHADVLDLHAHVVTILERPKPLVVRAGQDHVARHQRHVAGQEGQHLRHVVLHVAGVEVLPQFVIDREC